jgi:hypothetical protein
MVNGFKEKCMELALLRKDMIKLKDNGSKEKKWFEIKNLFFQEK